MSISLNDVPVYENKIVEIPAEYYNRIRLAQIRLPTPIHLALPGLRDIDAILDNDTWICVEASLNDLPILAWTEFDVEDRGALHEPVRCKLCLYNIHADLITETALKTIVEQIDSRLKNL